MGRHPKTFTRRDIPAKIAWSAIKGGAELKPASQAGSEARGKRPFNGCKGRAKFVNARRTRFYTRQFGANFTRYYFTGYYGGG